MMASSALLSLSPFAISQNPRLLDQRIAGSVRFLLTAFTEGNGNTLHQFSDMHEI
jgi:hypothetical protein